MAGAVNYLVNSTEELINLVVSEEIDDIEIDKVEFGDGFNVHLRLIGEQWDGKIDYKIGEYVTRLQRDVLGAYSELTGQKVSLKGPKEKLLDLRVTVTINDGSTEIIASIGEIFSKVIQDMPSSHKLIIAVLFIAGVGGLWGYKEYNRHAEKIEEYALQKVDKEAFKESQRMSNRIIEKYASSSNYLAGKMGSDDKIELPNDNIMLSKEEAQNLLPASVPEKEQNFEMIWVDDEFRIIAQNYDKGRVTLISPDGQKLEVQLLQMLPENREPFQTQIANQSIKGEDITLKLRLGIEIDNQATIHTAFIIKTDPEPNENYKSMAESFPVETH